MSSTGYLHFWMRPQLHIGAGSVVRLSAILNELGAKRILLVSDKGIVDAGVLNQVLEVFNANPYPTQPQIVHTYTDVAPDCTSTCINELITIARNSGADSIVAVGGGSVLDTAKTVKYCMQHNLDDIAPVLAEGFRMETIPFAKPSGIPFVSIPTTAGTGADISNGAIILDVDTSTKCVLVAPYFDADVSILDARLSLGLPPSITADTGMDALTHALESLCTAKANAMSDALSLGAVRLIDRNLATAVNEGQNIDARSNMMQAAALAITGLQHAIGSNLVHNCSHAYGAMFHIPHGRANAVFLPVVLETVPEFYLPHADKLCEAFGLPTQGLDAQAQLDSVIARIRALKEECHCPADFADFKLKPEEMEKMIMGIMTDPLYAFYPIPQDKVVSIVQQVLGAS